MAYICTYCSSENTYARHGYSFVGNGITYQSRECLDCGMEFRTSVIEDVEEEFDIKGIREMPNSNITPEQAAQLALLQQAAKFFFQVEYCAVQLVENNIGVLITVIANDSFATTFPVVGVCATAAGREVTMYAETANIGSLFI